MLYQDYIRVLYINMERSSSNIEERKDLKQYLGGVGVAAKLLEENMHPDLDPLDARQPIVLAIGALSSIYPAITKTVATFISPLTGEYGESHAGGHLAMSLLNAGYDAVVITGKAARPAYLTLSSGGVTFHDARTLWGTGNDITGQVIREKHMEQRGKRSIIQIGQAGENQIAYACVTVDRYRHFGRLGLGAVFGSKFIKAINVYGDGNVPIQDFPNYFKVYREAYKKCTGADTMEKYHDMGTSVNVLPLNALGALPTLNMKQGSFAHAEEISGEVFASDYLVRKVACAGCPIGCIHIGEVRKEFGGGHYEYDTKQVCYDYELIFALGSFLGLSDPADILELIDRVETEGLDAVGTGVVLGWATEAFKTGLISEKETLAPVEFGKPEPYKQMIHFIATAENEFYAHLGKGLRHAAGVYGGQGFAMQIAGNEMPGYPTGYYSLVGITVAARHSHLCNAGYSLDQKHMDDLDIGKIADDLFKEEVERCLYNSLVMCLFARKVYDRRLVLDALHAVGGDLTDEDLTDAAKRIYTTKLRIKQALGFDLKDVRLPKRFFETPTMHGKLDEKTACDLILQYREKAMQAMESGSFSF